MFEQGGIRERPLAKLRKFGSSVEENKRLDSDDGKGPDETVVWMAKGANVLPTHRENISVVQWRGPQWKYWDGKSLDTWKMRLALLGLVGLGAVAYFGVAKAGLALQVVQNTSSVWPATGFAIGLLLFGGNRFALSVLLGAFWANFSGFWSSDIPAERAALASLLIAAGNTAEAMVGSNVFLWMSARYNAPPFECIRSVLLLLAVCAVLAPLFSASLGVAGLHVAGVPVSAAVFFLWYSGDLLGALYFLPVFHFTVWIVPEAIRGGTFRSVTVSRACELLVALLYFVSVLVVILTLQLSPQVMLLLAFFLIPSGLLLSARFQLPGFVLQGVMVIAFNAILILEEPENSSVRNSTYGALYVSLVGVGNLFVAVGADELVRSKGEEKALRAQLESAVISEQTARAATEFDNTTLHIVEHISVASNQGVSPKDLVHIAVEKLVESGYIEAASFFNIHHPALPLVEATPEGDEVIVQVQVTGLRRLVEPNYRHEAEDEPMMGMVSIKHAFGSPERVGELESSLVTVCGSRSGSGLRGAELPSDFFLRIGRVESGCVIEPLESSYCAFLVLADERYIYGTMELAMSTPRHSLFYNQALVRAVKVCHTLIPVLRESIKAAYQRHRAIIKSAMDAERFKAKNIFIANVSHEIKTPVHKIFALTRMLEQTNGLDEEQRSYVKQLKTASQHQLVVVQDLLDFSKLDITYDPTGKQTSKGITINAEPFDLGETTKEAVSLVHDPLAHSHLTLRVMIDPETPTVVIGDMNRYRQVVVNLVSNALKYTERGYIAVSVSKKPQQKDQEGLCTIDVSVEDSGMGIPSDQLDSIFGIFNQSDYTREQRRGGYGLGLALSRKIAEAMGGSLRVESQLGKGSTFHFVSAFRTRVDPDTGRAGQSQDASLLAVAPFSILVAGADEEKRGELCKALRRIFAAKNLRGTLQEHATLEPMNKQLFQLVFASPELASSPDFQATAAAAARLDVPGSRGPARPRIVITGHVENLSPSAPVFAPSGPCSEYDSELKACLEANFTPSSCRVLGAEDDAVNQRILERMLRRCGFEDITLVHNGEAALEAAKKQTPHVILMDIMMPGIYDGLQATQLIREHFATLGNDVRIPWIVAMSASTLDTPAQRNLFDATLSKPFTPNQLHAALMR